MLTLDHLVITAPDLDEGTAWAEEALGVPLQEGGRHAVMGTHNRLLSLGPDLYLEVIAVDPQASPPAQARWFGLDDDLTAPKLTHWACRTDDLSRALDSAPPGHGRPMSITRGDLAWTMAVTSNGRLPLDDCYPALLSWQSALPGPRLTDRSVRLLELRVTHPNAAQMSLDIDDSRLVVSSGPKGFSARFSTPYGERSL